MADDNISAQERRANFTKRHPSEIHLRELANEIGSESEQLGTQLGFKKTDMDKFKANHRNFEDRIFNMLVTWKQRNYITNDLFGTLAKALEKVSRCDLVSKVEGWRDGPSISRDVLEEEDKIPTTPGSRPQLHRRNSRIDECEFRSIASDIGDEWPKFATFLGLKAVEIYHIKLSCTAEDDKVFNVMVKWQQKMAPNTNMVQTLANALGDSGREDLKEQLLQKYGSNETGKKKEATKEEVKKDLLEEYNLPPFLGDMAKAYQKVEAPRIPFDLYVNLCMALDTEDPQGNDWRMLADRLNLSQFVSYLKSSSYKDGPTSCVLWCWMKKNQTLEDLAKILDDINRGDASMLIRNFGKEDDDAKE